MASSIELRDIRKVIALVGEALGENYCNRDDRYLTRDNWEVLVGGWHHKQGWSRGFMVSDNLGTMHKPHRGYHSATHDGGRYEGRGWHRRMADDVVAAVLNLRAGT